MDTVPVRTRESYREELDYLLGELVEMAAFVAAAVRDATAALLEADLKTAEQVIAADAELDRARFDHEHQLFSLLARQAPVAGDLRLVVASLRVVTDLERMGDLAVHVAQIARMRYPQRAVPKPARQNFVTMAEITQQMVLGTGRLLAEADVAEAAVLETRDAQVDDLRRAQFRMLLTDDWAYGIEAAVDVALLGRYYERIADHAVTVAQRVVYMVTGG